MEKLLIVSGYSGSGKGTLIKNALKRYGNDLEMIRSVTTREKRNDDDCYSFVTNEEFEDLVKKGLLLEWNKYNENYYGTPLNELERITSEGKVALAEIDINGCKRIRQSIIAESFLIKTVFVYASPKTLLNRLISRGGEDRQQIIDRLNTSIEESFWVNNYDAIIDNVSVRGNQPLGVRRNRPIADKEKKPLP